MSVAFPIKYKNPELFEDISPKHYNI